MMKYDSATNNIRIVDYGLGLHGLLSRTTRGFQALLEKKTQPEPDFFNFAATILSGPR
jgi:hypothetical protein